MRGQMRERLLVRSAGMMSMCRVSMMGMSAFRLSVGQSMSKMSMMGISAFRLTKTSMTSMSKLSMMGMMGI